MRFEDEEVNNIDLTVFDFDKISRLIIEHLCGEKHYQSFPEDDKNLLADLINSSKSKGLNYEQFNELLLLLNQDRVKRGFFNFFFAKDRILLEDLKQGIIKFKGLAMLCFGNFRFAYKQLIQSDEGEIREKLEPYCLKESSELIESLNKRPAKMLEIDRIERGNTWYLGEISGARINKEAEVLREEMGKAEVGKSKFNMDDLNRFGKQLAEMAKYAEEAQKKAFKNTDIYLTWDYMDIYIATSMRNTWEFEETFDFVEKLFAKDSILNELNLRYFDPTQSKCRNSRDKGLIEGLMLKRALCTIYLAQESDTMGKDSELAATLVQKKPVIAYVPRYDPAEYSKKISEYPLEFFKRRLLILDADEIFEDKNFMDKLPAELKDYNENKKTFKFEEVINDFLSRLDEYRHDQPFFLWTDKEDALKKEYEDFLRTCQILAIAECYNFDRRADLLKGKHPLSMQVDLQSGVANGVLVVRSIEECAKLLYKILTNDMEFTIKHREEGFTILEENISESPFRVVTDNERLTNSFWNLFT